MAPPGPDTADFDRGRKVGKYEILTRLSIGGMAELFLAFTAGPGGFRKFVAVKQILPDVKKDPEFVKMFLDEARITAALSHANIGQVFDLGEEGGELYLAMEFISGQNLEQVMKTCLKKGVPIPVGLAARVVRDTALGLHYAHNFKEASGKPLPVIHRDVSPKNVMVTYEGSVKVIDFGIAKAKNRLGRTQVGIVKGTSGYMSPEQVRNLPLDGRSDLFSAGVILHELLCGKRLFNAPSPAAIMLQIAEDEITPPSAVNPAIPAALSEVVMRALARPLEERFASGKELARAIDAAMGAEVFDDDQTLAFMREIFEEKMNKTRALFDSASHDDAVELDAAAGALREDAEVSARPTPRGKTPRGYISAPAKPPPKRPSSGPQRFASKVAADYALYEENAGATEQEAASNKTPAMPLPRETAEVPIAKAPPAPAKAKGAGMPWGRLLLAAVASGMLVTAGTVKFGGPLSPYILPRYQGASKWAQEQFPSEPPPVEPSAIELKKPRLPPAAQALIDQQTQEQAAAPAPAPPQPTAAQPAAAVGPAAPLPHVPTLAEVEAQYQAEASKKPGGTAAAAKPPKVAKPPRTGNADEVQVLDTRTRAGAEQDKVGWLSLYTVPPAAIFDGATQLGNTPLRKVPMLAGTYRLRVVDAEGVDHMLSAPIKPGQETSLKIQISDLPTAP